MYTIFSDLKGRREGLVLAAGDNRLRVAVRGAQDVVELRHTQGQWVIDQSGPVQIEFLALENEWSEAAPHAMSASAGAHRQVA